MLRMMKRREIRRLERRASLLQRATFYDIGLAPLPVPADPFVIRHLRTRTLRNWIERSSGKERAALEREIHSREHPSWWHQWFPVDRGSVVRLEMREQ